MPNSFDQSPALLMQFKGIGQRHSCKFLQSSNLFCFSETCRELIGKIIVDIGVLLVEQKVGSNTVQSTVQST